VVLHPCSGRADGLGAHRLGREGTAMSDRWRYKKSTGNWWHHVEGGRGVTVFSSHSYFDGHPQGWKWVYQDDYSDLFDSAWSAMAAAEEALDLDMVVVPHWSASRFMLFDQCPQLFMERYGLGGSEPVPLESTEALCFGQAVHMGLEAHFNGDDGIRAFRHAWRAMTVELELNQQAISRTTTSGLSLVSQVIDLGLKGTPERGFSIDTNHELGAPIVGAMDLWDQDGNVVYDFKTTRGLWSQERAQHEVYQPLIYTWAAWEETDQWPAFEYIVMNRITGNLERFRREWTEDQWVAQMNGLWLRMEATAAAVKAGDFACSGKHGECPECGERWDHDHVCDESSHRRIRLL